MKTNAYRYLGLALMAVLTLSLTSCEVEVDRFYDDGYHQGDEYYNTTADLCSRTWVSYYWDGDGNRCRQELDFFTNSSGIDYIQVEYPNGKVKTFEYKFLWNWDNRIQTSIRMSYTVDDVSYLDDVHIAGNRLTGYLDGSDNYVEFKGRK